MATQRPLFSAASDLRDHLYNTEIQRRLDPIPAEAGDNLVIRVDTITVADLSHVTRVLDSLNYELHSWGTHGATFHQIPARRVFDLEPERYGDTYPRYIAGGQSLCAMPLKEMTSW
jgi:hypothetical protein